MQTARSGKQSDAISASLYYVYRMTEGRGRPSLKQLNDHVVQAVADKWRDLGVQLLNSGLAQGILDNTEANHKQVSL